MYIYIYIYISIYYRCTVIWGLRDVADLVCLVHLAVPRGVLRQSNNNNNADNND